MSRERPRLGRREDLQAQGDRRPKSFEVRLTDALVPATAAAKTTRRPHWLYNNHAAVSRLPVIAKQSPHAAARSRRDLAAGTPSPMGQFMINEARWGRGYAAMGAPFYRKPLWDSDGNNDGSKDGLFGAPSIAGIMEIRNAIAATIVSTAINATGQAWLAAAAATVINLQDDLLFTTLDIGTGYRDADEAWEDFGKKAAATAVTNAVTLGMGGLATAGTTVLGNAMLAGAQYAVNTAASAAINSVQWDSEGFFRGMDFNQRGFQETMTSRQTLTGLASAMIGGAAAGGTDAMSPEHMQATKRMGNLIGNTAQAGLEYAFLGETTLNVLNANMFGAGNLNQGLLEFNIGGDTSRLSFGGGGIDVSYGTVSQALAGREIWWENQRNTYHGLFGGNVTYADGYRGVRRTGAMLRSVMSYGNEVGQARREAILNGEIDEVVVGAIDHGGQTITENGRTTMHIGTLGERGRDGLFSRMAAGLVLQHEAYRDGSHDGEFGQGLETIDAVAAHTTMALRIEQDYQGFIGGDSVLSTQSKLLNRALQSGTEKDFAAFAEYALETYRSDGDFYFRLGNDGTLTYNETPGLQSQPRNNRTLNIAGDQGLNEHQSLVHYMGGQQAAIAYLGEHAGIASDTLAGLSEGKLGALIAMQAGGIANVNIDVLSPEVAGHHQRYGAFNALPETVKQHFGYSSGRYEYVPGGTENAFDHYELITSVYLRDRSVGKSVHAAGSLGTWIGQNIIDGQAFGQSVHLNQETLDSMALAEAYFTQTGSTYQPNIEGTFVPRTQRGSWLLSDHAKGIAIDMNPVQGNDFLRWRNPDGSTNQQGQDVINVWSAIVGQYVPDISGIENLTAASDILEQAMQNPLATFNNLPSTALALMSQQAELQRMLENATSITASTQIEQWMNTTSSQIATTMSAIDFLGGFETTEDLLSFGESQQHGYFNLDMDFVNSMEQAGFCSGGNWGSYGVFDNMHQYLCSP